MQNSKWGARRERVYVLTRLICAMPPNISLCCCCDVVRGAESLQTLV